MLPKLAVALALSLLAVMPAAAAPADNPASLLWPHPREVSPGAVLRLRLPLRVEAPPELARPAALMRREVETLFGPSAPHLAGGHVIRLSLAPGELTRPEEYTITSAPSGVLVRAHDEQGAFWAVHTVATLLSQARRTAGGYEVSIPILRDWPDTTFRAFMIEAEWTPHLDDVKHALELLARQHITYVAITFGPQIVLDFDPSIAQGGRFTKAQAREVVDYARSLGLKPIGYLNLLGHVDSSYQKAPYIQHGGLDIRKDETYEEFVYPILAELLDVYGPIEYFHCGMDEAWELFTWLSQEGEDVTGLLARHIERMNSFLNARGVKMVIWHDMLISPDLEKQLGAPPGPANGGPPQNTAGALAKIPKDVILDYWFYDPLPAYPGLDYLQSQGFTVWASPWQTPFSYVRYAATRHAPTLGTIWTSPAGSFSSPEFSAVSALYAQAAWNAAVAGPEVQPEPALIPAAQRAVNAVLWRRRSLRFPSDTALFLSPAGPRKQLVKRAPHLFSSVPLTMEKPVLLPQLPENTKPLADAAAATQVRLPGGDRLTLDGVNTGRGEDQLILYAAPQERTGTNVYGCEITVAANGAVETVTGLGSGDHAIPPGGFVLSAHVGATGEKANKLMSLHPGDRLAVFDAQGQWLGGTEPVLLLAQLPNSEVIRIDSEDHPRGAQQLVIYHPGYGDGRTETNQYGTEVIVRAGQVVEVQNDLGNARIPDDGYVLSVHGGGQHTADALRALRRGDPIRLLLERGGKREDFEAALTARQTRLPVGARLRALYLAVSSERGAPAGTPIGEWRVRYADGTVERILCRAGHDVLPATGQALPDGVDDSVWMVDDNAGRFLVREWPNPHPQQVVRDLLFVPAPALLEMGARLVAATAAAAPGNSGTAPDLPFDPASVPSTHSKSGAVPELPLLLSRNSVAVPGLPDRR